MRARQSLLIALGTFITLALASVPPAGADVAYVACSTSDNAFAFDSGNGSSGSAIDLLPEGNYPYDVTIAPDGDEVWITGASGDGVVVLDRASGAVTHRIAVGDYPVSVAFSADGALALVACRSSAGLYLIDTASYAVSGTLAIDSNYLGAGNLALDPVSGNFYLVEWYDDTLYEIAPDGSAVLRSAPLGDSLWQVVVSPDGTTVYLTDRGTDELRAIDRASLTETATLAVGDDPWGLDITEDGTVIVVCCEDDNTVQVVAVGAWTATTLVLPADADPRDVDILDATGTAYVCTGDVSGNDGIYLIDLETAQLVDTYTVAGANANALAVQAQVGSGSTGVETAPLALQLSGYPNPFNPSTTLSFTLDAPSPARVAIYDACGRRVRTLIDATLPAGPQQLRWDGRDASGRVLPGGVYFAQVATAGTKDVAKLVLIK